MKNKLKFITLGLLLTLSACGEANINEVIMEQPTTQAPVNVSANAVSSGTVIATHRKGVFDIPDKITVGKKIAENLSNTAVIELAKKHKGAELLVRTDGKAEVNGYFTKSKFSVYELSVTNNKTLSSDDLVEHVSFSKDIPKKLGLTSAKSVIIASDTTATDKDFIYYLHVAANGTFGSEQGFREDIMRE